MISENHAFVSVAGDVRGQTLRVLGQIVTERISSDNSDGRYYVMEEITPSGMGVPPHRHEFDDEIVFINEGEFEIYLNGVVTKAGPGAVLNFARGTFHGFRCISQTAGKTTWVAIPGTYAQAILRGISALPPGAPDLAKLAAINAENGITMPPPSPAWW